MHLYIWKALCILRNSLRKKEISSFYLSEQIALVYIFLSNQVDKT